MKSKMTTESRPSLLLSKDENDLIFKLIGQRCQSLATAVVQLFMTEGPAHNQWFKRDTGILCLVKDNSKKSYYFRIYCMQRKAMIWEHEVYSQIEYKSPKPFLHTFEAEECITAFNFASEEEARILKNSLTEKIEQRKHKREEKRQKSMNPARMSIHNQGSTTNIPPASHQNRHGGMGINNSINNTVTPVTNNTHMQNGLFNSLPVQKSISSGFKGSSAIKKSKSKKLTKADIGLPQDFKHVSHVGWNANTGFDVENLPEEDMKDFFSKAGVSDSQLRDKETRDFIYDFIQNHGGVSAVKEALVEEEDKITNTISTPIGRPQLPPPVPIRNAAAPVAHASVAREQNGPRLAPPPPARAPPPPPPPIQKQLPAPPQSAVPPPPPPPPAPCALISPQPVESAIPKAPVSQGQPDMRAALLDSIRGGISLKAVEPDRKVPEDKQEHKRGDLLSEIRQGIELRSVTTKVVEERKSVQQAGLAGALARALEERSKVMHSDSSGDEGDTTSDGDEWED